MEKLQVPGLYRDELKQAAFDLGEKTFRGEQVFQWVHQKRALTFGEMSNLPKSLQTKLGEVWQITPLTIQTRQTSPDGTRKYLLEMEDVQAIECVLIPHDYGQSICVSTQAGCGMGCSFCASSDGGKVRDLTAAEIVAQALYIQKDIDPDGQRVARVDFMGTGEPLENYDNVLRAIRIFGDPEGMGIGMRRISISTCGLVPGIKRLAKEGLPVTLSVSLHSANNAVRSTLMPVNRKYPVEELLRACDEYAEETGRRITYEYALIKGKNDSIADARALSSLLRARLAHVNLIPVNEVAGRSFVRSDPATVELFKNELEKAGTVVSLRHEMGGGIDAACGQLRRRGSGASRTKI